MTTHAHLDAILSRHDGAERDSLIAILQEIQAEAGHLSPEAVREVARYLSLPASKVYGVATFYNQFRFQAPGRHHVQVCRGTACHVKGSAAVLEAAERALGIAEGQTTRDGLFSLEEVACIGACGLAPVIKVDDTFHAAVTEEALEALVARLREEAEHV